MAQPLRHPYRDFRTNASDDTPLPQVPFEQSGLLTFAEHALDPTHPLNVGNDGPPLVRRLDRGNLATTDEFVEYLRDGWGLAQQLRHAAVVSASNAARWVANCVINDPLRLHWHVRRLDGVSPSSAWAYVAEAEGKRSFFATARELDEIRLMMRQPSEQNWNMFRGTVLEDLNRRLFYHFYRTSFVHDEDGYKAVCAVRGTPAHPWLIGNPDDMAFYIKGGGRRRVLIDYKCPAQAKDAAEEPLMEYQVQLHGYDMMADHAQRPADAIFLCHLYVADDIAQMWAAMLDENPEYIAEIFNQARFLMKHRFSAIDLALQPMAIDVDLKNRIRRACDAADRRIQQGLLSPYPTRRSIDLPPEQLERAQLLEPTLARALVYQRQLEEHIGGLKKELSSIFLGVDLGGAKAPVPLLSITQPVKLDIEQAVSALRAKGVDTQPLEHTSSDVEYNSKEVRTALDQSGIPAHLYENSAVTVGLSRAKSGPAVQQIAELRAEAAAQCRAMFPIPPAAQPAPRDREPDAAPDFMAIR